MLQGVKCVDCQVLTTQRRRRRQKLDNALSKQTDFYLQLFMNMQNESKDNMPEVVREIQEYIKNNYYQIKSESNIFGTITIEVKACHVIMALEFLKKKGAELAEMPKYSLPLRRNTDVSLTFYSVELGIVNSPI